MKMTAKWIALLLALTLLIGCAAGCKKKQAAAATTQATATTAAPTAAPTDDTLAPTDAPAAEDATAAPTDPAAAPTDATVAPVDTGSQETTGAPNTTEDIYSEEMPEDEEYQEDFVDELGSPPPITVKWEVYDAMSDAEKNAYKACFTNENAFIYWEEMAFNEYETNMMELDYAMDGVLSLKAALELMLGQELD